MRGILSGYRERLGRVEDHLHGVRIVLHSKNSDVAHQEFYGLLMAHFAIRDLMHQAIGRTMFLLVAGFSLAGCVSTSTSRRPERAMHPAAHGSVDVARTQSLRELDVVPIVSAYSTSGADGENYPTFYYRRLLPEYRYYSSIGVATAPHHQDQGRTGFAHCGG